MPQKTLFFLTAEGEKVNGSVLAVEKRERRRERRKGNSVEKRWEGETERATEGSRQYSKDAERGFPFSVLSVWRKRVQRGLLRIYVV
ncbi:hypothetical protein L6164_026877 [Bauhinia variegata]|uniref:Uncharacterized protein n=1 Tax=Bauhinia variegata TaxID=167791 RepID=A0ACB9LRH6_BAUVA|nr:hypothetical protein L6164_026877 [Bauhinia variegata]